MILGVVAGIEMSVSQVQHIGVQVFCSYLKQKGIGVWKKGFIRKFGGGEGV